MKKTTIIILAVLPIVLLVIISFAGRIISSYQHIAVERIEFLNKAILFFPLMYLLTRIPFYFFLWAKLPYPL